MDDTSFAERLRILSDARGFGFAELARHLGDWGCGRSRWAARHWLAGRSRPRIDAAVLAESFGVTLADLYGPLPRLKRAAKVAAARAARKEAA